MMIESGALAGATVTITLKGDEPHFDVAKRPRRAVRSKVRVAESTAA